MVRSRPDHPAMWSFPHLLVTNSPRKKMERKKNTLQFSQLFGLKTVSCISEKQRQQFHKNATQPAKQQGHFNNLAAMSPAKPVSPAPSSTTPMAAKAAQRCHSEAGEPPSFASADTRRPDTCGESLWDPDIFDQKMPHTEDCPMRIPPFYQSVIFGAISKKNVWNEKIGLNFECCEAFVLEGTASSKPKWKLRWFCPMRQWRTIKKGNKDSFRSPNSLSSALSSGARCSAGGWLPVPTEVRPAKTTEASHATQLVRLLDSVALRVASRASRMKCSGRCSNLKHRPDAWIAETQSKQKKDTQILDACCPNLWNTKINTQVEFQKKK